jgi:hypothetical protein
MTFDPRAGSGVAGDSLHRHLNMAADIDRGNLGIYTGCTFIFGLSEEVSTKVIDVLQDFFQATPIGRAFNERLKKSNKEVVILDEFALDTQSLPQVVVTAVPADNLPVSLGNRLGTETYGTQLFDVYGGLINMNVTLDLYDSGKPNVCQLADIIFLSFMQYVRDRLIPCGITSQPQVKFTKATKVNGVVVGGEVYKISLNVPVVSEWKQYLEIETVDVESIETQPTPEA